MSIENNEKEFDPDIVLQYLNRRREEDKADEELWKRNIKNYQKQRPFNSNFTFEEND